MQVTAGLLAIATPREVQEMNISLLLENPTWLEDECEFDIINLTRSVCHSSLVSVMWTLKSSYHH